MDQRLFFKLYIIGTWLRSVQAFCDFHLNFKGSTSEDQIIFVSKKHFNLLDMYIFFLASECQYICLYLLL